MLKQYKITLILTSLLTLLPIPLSMLLGREGSAVVLLPLILLADQWFCVFWTMKDPKNARQSKKTMTLVLWIIPVLSNLLMAVDYALIKGLPFSVSAVFCLLFGVMFIAIGNYLPKTRQNYTIGIKIFWTYTSEENWNATHRFGGKIWVIGGIVLALASLLPQTLSFGVLLAVTLLMIALPIAYSYRFYRRQKAAGVPLSAPPTMGKRTGKYVLIFLAALLIFVGVSMFTGDIAYRFEDDYFVVEADYYDDLVLHYDVIDSLEYRPEKVDGLRAWGYGSARLLMGTFQNDEFGTYTRYTYTKSQSAVVLTTAGRTIVLAAKTPAETQALYTALLERTEN